MKKIAFAPFVVAASLALSACGGNTTENTAVSNEIVLNEEEPVLDGNLTAVDSLNSADVALDNAADASLNVADDAANATTNAL